MRHLITLNDCSRDWILEVLDLAARAKAEPEAYADAMRRRDLLMIFEKPSLRTRVSFEAGMTQMGGHAIHYDLSTSPLAAGKETIHDMVKVAGRYVDLIMARLFEHEHMEEMAAHAEVPVINALTNFTHPCQVLADLLTIREKKGRLEGLKLAYLGDACNNVTHSLMYGCTRVGMHVAVGCPGEEQFRPLPAVLEAAGRTAVGQGTELVVTSDAAAAARGADVVYTDSWMSYHIPKEERDARVRILTPYQVNADLMRHARQDALFMNCLPAARGYEQTAEVIDGPQSVVFDQAENRLHAQKAVMMKLLAETASAGA
jgi:ornithine carbamoyltransferase